MHLVETKVEGSGGLVGWLIAAWRELKVERQSAVKRMKVVETLALGAKNKLVLVSYGGERFLVGTGPETVGTIVRVRDEGRGLSLVREMGS